jgi:hypothetical protein
MARSLLFLLLLLVFACNNLEDATVPDRHTFIRFFGSVRSYSSISVERDTDGGFILVGNASPLESDQATEEQTLPGIIIVKTNDQGTKLWEKTIPNANVHSIKPLTDGYLVTGEGIDLNPNSSESSEFVNSQFLLLKLNATGDVVQQFEKDSSVVVIRGQESVPLNVDFKAMATAVLPGGTQIATLGSYKVPGSQERTITLGFDISDVTHPVWRKNLDLLNFDYVSTNFLGLSGPNLIWASTATPTDVNASKYVSVIAVPPNYASPSNNSLFGKSEEGGHDIKDLQPSATGFAAIGTYTNKATGNKNVFFVKIDAAGNVMENTVRYFDCGATSSQNITLSKATDAGVSQDDGTAITYTRDGGFVLACSMQQTPDKGNGGTDIILIKIDAFGNYMWDKLMGGSGNEVATSIRELPDGTLLISGTSTISNVSSMFIIRADGNGDLKE